MTTTTQPTTETTTFYVTVRHYMHCGARFNGITVLCYLDERGDLACFDCLEMHNHMTRAFYYQNTRAGIRKEYGSPKSIVQKYEDMDKHESLNCRFVLSKRLCNPTTTPRVESAA